MNYNGSMPEDLKLSQIGSSQLPPPLRGLHSPGVRKRCQIIFACYFHKSSIPHHHISHRVVTLHILHYVTFHIPGHHSPHHAIFHIAHFCISVAFHIAPCLKLQHSTHTTFHISNHISHRTIIHIKSTTSRHTTSRPHSTSDHAMHSTTFKYK